jgi:Ribosomal protein S9/S16.
MRYDPYMLKGDPNTAEPKKPGLKHARSKRQKAYR